MQPLEIPHQPSILIDRVLPGDKSISHRAAILASIAEGESILRNVAPGEDLASTIRCLIQLGVEIRSSPNEIRIYGKGLFGLGRSERYLDCGNSGTTARLLSGVLAGQKFNSVLTGDSSLSCRPMGRIVEPLRHMGANIRTTERGTLPMHITGSSLNAIRHTMQVPSAQVKSGVLLAGLYAHGETTVLETSQTRDHTERLLPVIQKTESQDGRILSIKGGSSVRPFDMTIPGDFSSSAFFMGVGAMIPHSQIQLRKVGLNPTRTGLLDVLIKMGVCVRITNRTDDTIEPFGDISVTHHETPLKGCSLSGKVIPNIIDEIPILAVLGTLTDSGLEIRSASELRRKECDRIAALVYNLRNMGAEVDEFEDGFFVHPCTLKPAAIKTFGDHRIAMAFTVAALSAGGGSTIDDTACINISFPDFFEYLGVHTNRHSYTTMFC